jgi:hypothetical protein
MQCHLCDHREAVEAGRFAGVPFADTPCGQCTLTESSAGTLAFVENQGGKNPQISEPTSLTTGDQTFNERMVPVSVVMGLVSGLLSLPPDALTILALRWQGFKYRELAQMQGVTTAAVELRHKRILDSWPLLRALFPVKSGKQARRKRHRKPLLSAPNDGT